MLLRHVETKQSQTQVSESCKRSFYISKAFTHTLTHLRDRFYKTLHWDFYSHVPPLTVVHFVLQYLPKIYILSPSPFPLRHHPVVFFLPVFSPSVPPSPLLTLPGEGGAGSAADVGGGAAEARGGREEAPG